LIFLGQRLVGSNPARGLRAGIFLGVVGVILLGLVTRAIGYILESAGIAGTTGQAVTMVIGLVLVAALASLYFRGGFAGWLVRIEEQGWFTAAAYKKNQGLRVRRATMLGILILVGCGIYTMAVHDALKGTPYFSVSNGSLERLGKDQVPESVVAAMEPLIGQKYATADSFLDALAGRIPSGDIERYRNILRRDAETQSDWASSLPFTSGRAIVWLPDVRFSVPILLSAIAMWFAYRVVHLPVFADFLIATEAELNKVSWTSRKRLVQDTVVVLTTVLLFTVFLFVVDLLWVKVLSSSWIGVLPNPQSTGQKQASQDEW